MAFSVGQKVACVDDRSTGKYLPSGFSLQEDGDRSMHGLRKDDVYTIRDIGIQNGVPVCWLEEIQRPIEPLFLCEAAYAQARFRPLTDTKTSISFTEGAPRSTRHLDNRHKLPAKVSS